ncbi:MAG: hypothetical protein J6A01_06910 [Proteobacteria bacterium]|nr:hypothetical protein [Pseudomonadota bacterium]
MACFIVPATEAIITTIVHKVIAKKESQSEKTDTTTIPWSRKISWLSNMLWGGSFLLAFEHIWHGEVVPWYPFLTAMSSPDSTAEMLHEMSTVGVAMALLVTAVWGIMLAVAHAIEKRPAIDQETKEP